MPIYGNEHVSNEALKCALVLRTVSAGGEEEFRIGRFIEPFYVTRLRSGPAALNAEAAVACFGKSAIYQNRSIALEKADIHYPRHTGIKVFHMPCTFPD